MARALRRSPAELLDRWLPGTSRWWLLGLLAVGALLAGVSVGVGLAERAGAAPDPGLVAAFDLGSDTGVPERWNFLQWATAAVLAVRGARRGDRRTGLGLAGVSLLLLADDALQLHERTGAWLADRATIGPPLVRTQDVGELLYWSVQGLVVLAVLVLLHRRGGTATRRAVVTIGLAILGLVATGVVLDLVHANTGGLLSAVAGVVEDAGEMALISLVVAAVHVWQDRTARDAPAGARSIPAAR